MGLFSRRIKDPVRGTAYVASATSAPSGTSSASCGMQLTLSVPGEVSVAVEKTAMVSTKRWPFSGMSLPIEAERGNPTRFRIMWDELPTGRERGRNAAEEMAERMNAQTPSASAPQPHAPQPQANSVVTSSSVTINGRPATPEEIAQYETLVGMDLNGDGVVGGAGTATPQTPKLGKNAAAAFEKFFAGADGAAAIVPGESDRVSTLERLAALRDSGALTPEEFEAEKKRILGSG